MLKEMGTAVSECIRLENIDNGWMRDSEKGIQKREPDDNDRALGFQGSNDIGIWKLTYTHDAAAKLP